MGKNEFVKEMVRDLLRLGQDSYLRTKICLLAETSNTDLSDFTHKLFAYTDSVRPPLLCIK